MKYLRRFNESVVEIDETVSVLDQMCLEMRDKDLYVEVNPYPRYQSMKRFDDLNQVKICLDIRNDEEAYHKFDIEKVKSEIFDIVNYMKSEGWKIHTCDVMNDYGKNDVTIEDGKIISVSRAQHSITKKRVEQEVNYPVYQLYIEFKKM